MSRDWRRNHGGNLRTAARDSDIALNDWLDLSTGINPQGWPVPELPAEVWRRLPETEDGLADIARQWAGAPAAAGCLPVPGSQAAIQHLPRLRRPGRVGVPSPGYGEHARWWAEAGHEVVPIDVPAEDRIAELDILVWIHPNNPTGELRTRSELLEWHERLAHDDGWLVVDEAFLTDAYQSLAPFSDRPGLFVLQSLGKFFGLAGLRAGLVLGESEPVRRLDEVLGPWALSHPARHIMAQALRDSAWQTRTRSALAQASLRLQRRLEAHDFHVAGRSDFFCWCPVSETARLDAQLKAEGVLVRTFIDPPALRFGLPGDAKQWRHLNRALERVARAY